MELLAVGFLITSLVALVFSLFKYRSERTAMLDELNPELIMQYLDRVEDIDVLREISNEADMQVLLIYIKALEGIPRLD